MTKAALEDHISSVGLIGFGRFGQLLQEIIAEAKPTLTIKVASRSKPCDDRLFFPWDEVASCDLIIPTMPIRHFQENIARLAAVLQPGQSVLDVCSVKVHPQRVMQELLPSAVQLISSHPMFGPASYRKRGSLLGFTVVLEPLRVDPDYYRALKEFFNDLGLRVVEITGEQHDRLAARSHFLALTAAMVLKRAEFGRTEIDTSSAAVLQDFLEMISVDCDLVKDLYDFNSYCRRELTVFSEALQTLKDQLEAE